MRVLRKGLVGPDVYAWQNFLRGLNKGSKILANSTFDDFTHAETTAFQESSPGKLVGDGVVGPLTVAKAMRAGFNPLEDPDSDDEFSAAWPKQPSGVNRLSEADRNKLFGTFKYVAAPTAGNPEGIKIVDDWAKKNIVQVHIPQLQGIKGAPKSCSVPFHKLAAPQLQRCFAALEQRDLIKHLKTWDGTWVPRFVRGSKTRLSNHSWASALDLNYEWNKLGTQGALKGQEGSVREMVETFAEHGLFWGGWFLGRRDCMHYEVYKIL